MTHILQIVWPIADSTYTRAELIADARAQLDEYADEAGGIITGPPIWLRIPAKEVPGWKAYPGDVLIARMPAIPDEEYSAWRALRDVDHSKVAAALNGQITARQLSTPERRLLVEQLMAEGLNDTEIGVRLRWSDTPKKARNCVLRFRSFHQIRREPPRKRVAA